LEALSQECQHTLAQKNPVRPEISTKTGGWADILDEFIQVGGYCVGETGVDIGAVNLP
jgi:hypothetical protein